MTDHEAMLQIQEALDGREWNADTLETIAAILVEAGYRLRYLDEIDSDLDEIDCDDSEALERLPS